MITLLGSPLSTNSIYKRSKFSYYMTDAGKAKKEQYQWECKGQWKQKMLTGKVEVVIYLYFADKRNHDVDNYNKLVLDSMSGIVFEDDSQIQRLTIEKFYNKTEPKIEVEIYPIE